MKTRCDNKGTAVSKASLFDLYTREDHSAVGDLPAPPPKKRAGSFVKLQSLTVLSSQRLLFFLPEFGAKLEKDVCGDTSGYYQKLLVILLQVQKRKETAALLFRYNEDLW